MDDSNDSESNEEESPTPTEPSIVTPDETPKYRTRLSCVMTKHKLSIWQILKSAIGKDLTRMSLPVEVFEPLSILQVYCEDLEFSDLLDKAAAENDQYTRMSLVTAFAISRYSSTRLRGQGKPFNPIEGETYECVRNNLGWRFVAEQVSHHPPVSSCYATGRGWVVSHSSQFELAFWGRYVQAKPTTPIDVTLQQFKETYRWNRVITTVHNLFSGTRYIDHHGQMNVRCSNKISCTLNFRKSTHEILGHVHDVSGDTVRKLSGTWSDHIDMDGVRLWTANMLPSFSSEQYGFGEFAASLNEVTEDIRQLIPPTDSRFRTDIKAFEEGNVEEAKKHKHRLEAEQRKRRHSRKEYIPKWFTKHQTGKEKSYVYNHKYWEARAAGFAGFQFEKLW